MEGLGVLINRLAGGNGVNPEKFYGKKIAEASFCADRFLITFDDCIKIQITDDGQSCCESRYMICDDDTGAVVGHVLKDIIVKYANKKDEKDYSDKHEIAFLDIVTDGATIQFATHNEHNGYYGGFSLTVKEVSE